MIKIRTGKGAVSTDRLREKLEQALPVYQFKKRGKNIFVAKKSALIGAVIVQKKKFIRVSGNFPGFYLSMIFAIITVLSGIFIPVILYFIFIHGKLRKAEKEVGGCLKDHITSVTSL